MARSPLFVRKQPGGVYHIDNTALTVGNIWYVDTNSAGEGTTSAYGYNPDSALSSVANAWDRSDPALGTGDIILVAAGHTESVSAAAGWDCDTAGVKLMGLGWGNIRPTITLNTANTADIDIDAASIMFENLIFVANFLDIAAAIDVNAAAFWMRNCLCYDTSTILNALIWVLGASSTTSNAMVVEGCEFNAFGTANTACISMPGTSDRCKILDNTMIGDWGTAAILAAGVITKAVILRNVVSNLDAGDDKCINIADTSTGICAYNGVGARETDNSTDNITCGTTMTLVQNYSVDEGDRQAVLDPVAT